VQFSESQGVYKDLNARYNTAFSRYAGITSIYYGGLAALPFIAAPQKDNVTLVVQRYAIFFNRLEHGYIFLFPSRVGSSVNETIVVPYLVAWEGTSFSNKDQYWNTNCFEPSALDTVAPLTGKKQHLMAKMPHKEKIHKKTKLDESPDGNRIVQTVSNGGTQKKLSSKSSVIARSKDEIIVLVDSYVSVNFNCT
jgi:hypothetical protein